MALHDIREIHSPNEQDKPCMLLFDLNTFAGAGEKIRFPGPGVPEDAAGLREGRPHVAEGGASAG